MRIRADTTGMSRLVDRLVNQTRPNGPIHDAVKSSMGPRMAEPFIRQRSPYGQGWAPLAASTIADRLRKGFPAGPIQIRTGETFRRMQQVVSDGDSVVFGPSPKFGSFLNEGTNRMPARPFAPEDGNLPIAWREDLEREIEGTIRRVRR